jgi:hypothetical protein
MSGIVPSYAAFPKRHQQSPVSGKFIDLLKRNIRQPDVIVVVNGQSMWHCEEVGSPSSE